MRCEWVRLFRPERISLTQRAHRQSYEDETLRPLTVNQVQSYKEPYPGAEASIDGRTVTQVMIVGQVRAINPQTTNVTYKVDDGTGVIDVKKWVDAEQPEDATPQFQLDQYVRVYGRIKTFGDRNHIGAQFMRAVDDYNEVNYHLLEATYVHLLLQKQAKGGASGGQGGGEDSMFVDNGDGQGGGVDNGNASAQRLAGRSAAAKTIFNFLQNAPGGNEGVHLNIIASSTHLPVRDVIAAADELLTNGMIYTTLDDETWAVLDY
jgi:replication factor A2